MKDYEGTVLFWFLPSPAKDHYDLDNFHALKKIMNNVQVFDENDNYVDQLKSITDETVFVILGLGCNKLLDNLLLLQAIRFIYLREPHHHQQTSIVRGVFQDEYELRIQLEKDVKMAIESNTHLCLASDGDLKRSHTSFQNLQTSQGNFSFLQYLLQIILVTRGSKGNGFHDLIQECRLTYQNNPAQICMINEFEETYNAANSILWYTKDSFLYKMINRALRTENIAIILKFRFFIQDLYYQLKKIHEEQRRAKKDSTFHRYEVYRGQKISVNELDDLEKSVGGRFGMNSFLSTSKNLKTALIFAGDNVEVSRYKPAIFKISIDEEELGNDYLPFADISSVSDFGDSEGEVLLCMGTIMEIKSVKVIDGVVWIHLNMCQSDNSIRDEQFVNIIQKAALSDDFDDQYILLYIGAVLMLRGEYRKGEQVMNEMKLTGIPLLDTFGQICLKISNKLQLDLYDNARTSDLHLIQDFYKTTLSALENTQFPDNSQIEMMQKLEQERSLFNSSGFTLSSLLENQPTGSRTEEPLVQKPQHPKTNIDTTESMSQMYDSNNSSLIASIAAQLKGKLDKPIYGNIATPTCVSEILMNYVLEKGDYDQAIRFGEEILSASSCEEEVYNMCKKLARLYEKQGNLSASITCLQKVISNPELSPNSHDKINACIDCGDIYMKTDDKSHALLYYQQALGILDHHYPSDHPLIGRILVKIGYYFEKTSDIQSALEYYDRAIKHGHPSTVSEAYRNVGIIHSNEKDDLAREYFIRSLNIEETEKPLNLINLSHLYKLLIELEHRSGNHEQRDIYLDRLLKLETSDERFRDSLIETIQSVFENIGFYNQ